MEPTIIPRPVPTFRQPLQALLRAASEPPQLEWLARAQQVQPEAVRAVLTELVNDEVAAFNEWRDIQATTRFLCSVVDAVQTHFGSNDDEDEVETLLDVFRGYSVTPQVRAAPPPPLVPRRAPRHLRPPPPLLPCRC